MKDKMADTLMNLMKEHRYKDITIGMICKAVPVSRNTFYYHFEEKQDLLIWTCIRNHQKYGFPHYVFGDDVSGTRMLFRYIKQYKEFYRAIYDVDNGILLKHCFMQAHISCTDLEHVKMYAKLQKGNNRKISKEVYVRYATAGIASVLTYWVAMNYSIPIDTIAEDLNVMLTESLPNVRNKYVY